MVIGGDARLSEYLTTGEAARHANVAIQTIHNWIEAGHIEAKEEWQGTKRVRKIKRESLEAWLAAIAARKSEGS